MINNTVKIVNDLLNTNTYIYTLNNKKCFIIDPGSDFTSIQNYITNNFLQPIAIFLTHGHFDHIASAAILKKNYNCKLYIHKNDIKIAQLSNFLLKIFGFNKQIEIPIFDFLIEKSYLELEIEKKKITYTNLQGHTKGSCIIQIDDILFTGDIILKTSDNSKIPNENPKELKISQNFILNKYSNFYIYPGHGQSGHISNFKDILK